MFERFTEKAMKVIMLAQEEARRLGHNLIGTELMLLGMVGEGSGTAANVLKSLGITLEDARKQVELHVGRGSGFVAVEIPFTPRAKKVMRLASRVSEQNEGSTITTRELLLGLIDEGDGLAVTVLQELGVDLVELRQRTVDYRTDQITDSAEPTVMSRQRISSPNPPPPAPPIPNQTRSRTTGSGPIALSEPAQRVLERARAEAQSTCHNFLGTEQILLGLIDRDAPLAMSALQSCGVNLKDARIEVMKIIGTGSGSTGECPQTPRTKRALEQAEQVAREANSDLVEPEHLLLGIIAGQDGAAIRVLENLGLNVDMLAKKVRELIAEPPPRSGRGGIS